MMLMSGMNGSLLANEISKEDKLTSSKNIDLLLPYIVSGDRSLVFFVGAGASFSGNTGMPSTPSLLYQVLFQALSRSGELTGELDKFSVSIKDISARIGFEITLNDFWQICRNAITLLFQA